MAIITRLAFCVLFSISIPQICFGQVDTTKSIYERLDTLKFYNVGLAYDGFVNPEVYTVNNKPVDKKTYDNYMQVWDNIGKCKPCILETYNENDTLVSLGAQYTDCRIGQWIEYYPSGKIKLIGHYKENNTGKWNKRIAGKFCEIKNGSWVYYDENGNVTKMEMYKNNALLK